MPVVKLLMVVRKAGGRWATGRNGLREDAEQGLRSVDPFQSAAEARLKKV